MRACRLLVLVAAAVSLSTEAFSQARVEASVNAERVGVEDVLELTVSISGGRGEPRLPAMDGFRVGGRSSSSQVSFVNGQMSSTNSFIYELYPEREGTFTIDPIEVELGGETKRTDPIEVAVVAGSVVPRRGRSSSPFGSLSPFGRSRSRVRDRAPELSADDVLLRAEVSKSSVFQGEAVVVTYRLYTRYVPLGPQIEDDPPMTGFWVEEVELPQDTRAERRDVDGREYLAFTLKQRVLFPTQSGTVQIPSLTLSTAFRMSSGDPFDSFFSRGSRPITVRSAAIPLDVKPLPAEGRGRDFRGAVGRFQMTAELSVDTVAAGDPVTLTLGIDGEGNLRTVKAPPLANVPDFRAFDPKTEERLRATGRGLSGSKQWEHVLVPESGGTKELGPWSFQYFDPEAGAYRVASAGPLVLDVTGSTVATADGVTRRSAGGEVTVLGGDIRFLKPAPSSFGAVARPYFGSPLFYLTLGLPILWNMAFLLYQRKKAHEKTHSSLFRSRRAQRVAQTRFREARKLAADASKGFYEEVAAALYRYVGDKTSASASGLTAPLIDGLLEERSVSEPSRKEFLAVLAECEEARFTPTERGRDEMEAALARAETLVVRLEKELK